MLLGFRQSFKAPENSISRTNIFTNLAGKIDTNLVGKNLFQPEIFSETPTSTLN